jgi:hypothetical protein
MLLASAGLLFAAAAFPPPPPPAGTPTFSNMFAGGAVLQRGGEVSVWGTGGTGGVTLYVGGRRAAAATVGADYRLRYSTLLYGNSVANL